MGAFVIDGSIHDLERAARAQVKISKWEVASLKNVRRILHLVVPMMLHNFRVRVMKVGQMSTVSSQAITITIGDQLNIHFMPPYFTIIFFRDIDHVGWGYTARDGAGGGASAFSSVWAIDSITPNIRSWFA